MAHQLCPTRQTPSRALLQPHLPGLLPRPARPCGRRGTSLLCLEELFGQATLWPLLSRLWNEGQAPWAASSPLACCLDKAGPRTGTGVVPAAPAYMCRGPSEAGRENGDLGLPSGSCHAAGAGCEGTCNPWWGATGHRTGPGGHREPLLPALGLRACVTGCTRCVRNLSRDTSAYPAFPGDPGSRRGPFCPDPGGAWLRDTQGNLRTWRGCISRLPEISPHLFLSSPHPPKPDMRPWVVPAWGPPHSPSCLPQG